MELKAALKEQYHAGLAMLAECVRKCPDDLWHSECANPRNDEQIVHSRAVWRIAFHNAYFTHLYLGQSAEAFVPPPSGLAVRRPDLAGMWEAPWNLEPYEFPVQTPPVTREDVLAYIAAIDEIVDETVDGLDLESDSTGFPWYPNMSKLSHQLMNLRHIQGHVGQLSELLMLRGIDTSWIARR